MARFSQLSPALKRMNQRLTVLRCAILLRDTSVTGEKLPPIEERDISFNAGQVAVYDPSTGDVREWCLPGTAPQAYAVYVDERDKVWLTDFGGNAIHRFDPETEAFDTFPLSSSPGDVRQLLGRPGEVWGAESAADQLVVIRY